MFCFVFKPRAKNIAFFKKEKYQSTCGQDLNKAQLGFRDSWHTTLQLSYAKQKKSNK